MVNNTNLDPDLKPGKMLINGNFHLEWYCLINTCALKKLSGQLS